MSILDKYPIKIFCPTTELTTLKDLISSPSKQFLRKKKPGIFDPKNANLSSLCLDLLAKLLRFDPTERISIEEALAHPFFAQIRDHKYEIKSSKKYELTDAHIRQVVIDCFGGL
jgi:serine/threonine protein kinase